MHSPPVQFTAVSGVASRRSRVSAVARLASCHTTHCRPVLGLDVTASTVFALLVAAVTLAMTLLSNACFRFFRLRL